MCTSLTPSHLPDSTLIPDDAELGAGGPFGSDPDLYETDLDLGQVPDSPPLVSCRTAGGVEVTVRPGPNHMIRKERESE